MDSPANSLNPNKILKEQLGITTTPIPPSYTDLSLQTPSNLFSLNQLLMLLRHLLGFNARIDPDTKGTSLKKNDNPTVTSKNWRAYMVAVAVDFLSIFLPLILVSTVLAEWTYVSAICLVLLLLFSAAFKRERSSRYREDGVLSVRTYISFYRVAMMLVTCLCILAVDFSIFPRRYAKTETYGVSLMDIGVGSFVLANSLVSRQARGIATVKLRNAVQSTSPLLFLGFARLISTAGVDYQVHVGEYGVHWNFFFTLAAVSVLTSIINVPPNYSGFLGSSILLGYQVFLKRGLNVYLLSNERGGDIISQNKEGIFSIFGKFGKFTKWLPAEALVVGLDSFTDFDVDACDGMSKQIIGYWGMYLVGVQLGSCLFFGNRSTSALRTNKWARTRIWILVLLFWYYFPRYFGFFKVFFPCLFYCDMTPISTSQVDNYFVRKARRKTFPQNDGEKQQ
ncbi:hypothetical protein RJ639_038524 [Escallonia herrerae]|uniref:Phosphatidylinositol-glycan biosynthesis class W protein n=1 Tax=Escallonia herrerae TaxID=1293975 RepID=A0AA88WL74_9ASTE|nr:hypothetical protein RJ639_038524 [Escallonia herrerae]